MLTGSVASDVVLDYDKGTAEKVYRPTKMVKALYALAYQAKFPYTDNVDAFEAARLRREIGGLLTEAWDGESLVAQTLDVRPTEDGRIVFVTELVRGTFPRDKQRARAFLNVLSKRFQEAGLPPWQVASYNPRAIGNLIERSDGSYRVIDLESNLVTPFLPPAAMVRAIRNGQYPSFDDINVARLESYVADNRDMLVMTIGIEKADRLAAATAEYGSAQGRWHASESRIAAKTLKFAFRLIDVPTWFRAIKRLTAGGERMAENVTRTGIDTWVAEGMLSEAEAEKAREQLATPEMTQATAHLGAHLAITVPLRFPLGSIARTGWTLTLRAKGEWQALRGKGSAKTARRVHSLPVAAIAAVPGFGSFAYLAAKPFRQEPVIRFPRVYQRPVDCRAPEPSGQPVASRPASSAATRASLTINAVFARMEAPSVSSAIRARSQGVNSGPAIPAASASAMARSTTSRATLSGSASASGTGTQTTMPEPRPRPR